jgi:hypothetical protein
MRTTPRGMDVDLLETLRPPVRAMRTCRSAVPTTSPRVATPGGGHEDALSQARTSAMAKLRPPVGAMRTGRPLTARRLARVLRPPVGR